MSQRQRIVVQPEQIDGTELRLTPEQQHYLVRVLRLKPSQQFVAMTGMGETWLAQLTETGAEIQEALTIASELPRSITLLLALPKGNTFDEVVRQVTELGVTQIVPILSDRTLLQPSPNRLDRWRKIAQEAAEQSERQTVPQILDPIAWKPYLKQRTLAANPNPNLQFFCWERGDSPHLLTALQTVDWPQISGEIAIAIGPEGGWTEAEVTQAISAGFQPVSLGQRILRAATAPIAAMALVAAILEK